MAKETSQTQQKAITDEKVNILYDKQLLTHSIKEREAQWKKEWGAEMLFSHGSTNARDVAVLI